MILTSLAIPARDNTINMVFVSRFSSSLDGKHPSKRAVEAFDAARYADPYLSNLVPEGFEYQAEDRQVEESPHQRHDYTLRVFFRPFEGAKLRPEKEFPKIAFRLGWLAYRCAGHPLVVDADSFDRGDYKATLRIALPGTAGLDLIWAYRELVETSDLMPLGRVLCSGRAEVAYITGEFLGELDKWAQLGRTLAHRQDAEYSHDLSWWR